MERLKKAFFIVVILVTSVLYGCGNNAVYNGENNKHYSNDENGDEGGAGTIKEFYAAEDFVYGNEELSDVDDEGNYIELYYEDGRAYAMIERENASVSVSLEVTYLFHEANTEGYYLMTTEITSGGEGKARADFSQEDGCVYKVKAVYTSITEGKETVITKELGELK